MSALVEMYALVERINAETQHVCSFTGHPHTNSFSIDISFAGVGELENVTSYCKPDTFQFKMVHEALAELLEEAGKVESSGT